VTTAASFAGVLGGVSLSGAAAASFAPTRALASAGGLATAAVGVTGLAGGVLAVAGDLGPGHVGWLVPLSGASFAADATSGLFLLVIGAVSVVAGLYTVGYAAHGHLGRTPLAVLPVFAGAMLAVPLAAAVTTLLLFWEVMAVTSLLLVLADWRREQVRAAALSYAAMTQLDTGTAFGGMGASREVTIAALVEPTILVAGVALSVPAGMSNLGRIVHATAADPGRVASPAFAFAALVVVVVAETGRLPVDNPATHLELTMVHEAMILEYTGPRLALVEWSAAMRLTVLLTLLANLFAPWGITGAGAGPAGLLVGLGAVVLKVLALGTVLAAAEVFLAKLRLFRVPQLLAGSFLLGLLAATTSYFLTGAAG
jgi:formate hydrogenlyase subunit 4